MRQVRRSWIHFAIPFYCVFLIGCSRRAQWKGISPYPTPLVAAIQRHDTERVRELLDSGANPNEISSMGPDSHGLPLNVRTPLAIAVSYPRNCDTAILKLLIDHGADPDGMNPILVERSTDYFTPLVVAIGSGLTKAVKYLLRRGANPNIIDPPDDLTGTSPLSWAMDSKDGTIRLAFVDRWSYGDASTSHRNKIYDTIISTLFKYGASPTQPDNRGLTPLHQAVWVCDSAVAEELIDRGASLTAKDKGGETPEDMARSLSCTSVLNVLLRQSNNK